MANVSIQKRGPNSYIVEVRGEDHTLGNLIATKLMELGLAKLAYYEVPHPLEDRLVIYVNLKEGVDIKDALLKAANSVLDDNKEFRRLFVEELKKRGLDVEEWAE